MNLRYPSAARERTAWILNGRGSKNRLDPLRPYAAIVEEEPDGDGSSIPVATIFLTNRECPWRCLMCDLWQNTLDETVAAGAVSEQIRWALQSFPAARWVKLYNAGSFFDPRAIPPDEYPEIASLLQPFERVIVECHPALVGARTITFQKLIPGRLEVAMGLETAHPEVLAKLNKGMTLDDFSRAAAFLKENQIDLRSFILVRPPFLSESEGIEWACRSLDFAWDCGARVCSLIPTRSGNGAMESLVATGDFRPPRLTSLESALEYGIGERRSLVFADLWDIDRFSDCTRCSDRRIARLREMIESQRIPQPVDCATCDPTTLRPYDPTTNPCTT